jgi:hypothetical protein
VAGTGTACIRKEPDPPDNGTVSAPAELVAKAFCLGIQGPAGATEARTVQIPGTGAFDHANTPPRLKVVTRNEEAAWQGMSEHSSPNKAKAVRRLAHSRVRGGFNCVSRIRANASLASRGLTGKPA